MTIPTHVHLLGTSHIAKQSVNDIKKTVDSFQPTIIAVELDRNRLYALLHNVQPSAHPRLIRQVGLTGYLFAVIGMYLQRHLAKKVSMKPGADMLAAVKLARDKRIKIALIDQDLQVTLKKLSKRFRWRERFQLIKDLFTGLRKQERMRIDLGSVPPQEMIDKLITQMKDRYPSLYLTLVKERNEYLAKRLQALSKLPEERILAVLGAGHVKEIARILEKSKNTNHKKR